MQANRTRYPRGATCLRSAHEKTRDFVYMKSSLASSLFMVHTISKKKHRTTERGKMNKERNIFDKKMLISDQENTHERKSEK